MNKLLIMLGAIGVTLAAVSCKGTDANPQKLEASVTTPPAGWVWFEDAAGQFRVSFPQAAPQEQAQEIAEDDVKMKNHIFMAQFGQEIETVGKSSAIIGYLEFTDPSQISNTELSLFEEQFFNSFISSFITSGGATETSRKKYSQNDVSGYDVEGKVNEYDRKVYLRIMRYGKKFYYQAIGLNDVEKFNPQDFFNSMSLDPASKATSESTPAAPPQ